MAIVIEGKVDILLKQIVDDTPAGGGALAVGVEKLTKTWGIEINVERGDSFASPSPV